MIIDALAGRAAAIAAKLPLRDRTALPTDLCDANLSPHPPLPLEERGKLFGFCDAPNDHSCTRLCALDDARRRRGP